MVFIRLVTRDLLKMKHAITLDTKNENNHDLQYWI